MVVEEASVENGIDFLASLYEDSLGYSAINTDMSALSSYWPMLSNLIQKFPGKYVLTIGEKLKTPWTDWGDRFWARYQPLSQENFQIPTLGNSWNPVQHFISHWGSFLGKKIIFSLLKLGKIMGRHFPSEGNIRENIGNILFWKQIQNCYFGKILGCVDTTQFFPNLFVFGIRTSWIYWINPNLAKDWEINPEF